jgi:hypothetical protein
MTMDQAEQLSELIGEIYDAALDPSLWSDVLGKAGRFVGGSVAAIFAKSPTSLTGNVYYHSSGKDPSYRQLYFNKYVKFDPTTTAQCFSAGICLVDAAGRIVHANAACHVILDAGDFLSAIGGGSSPAMPGSTRPFVSCLQPPVAVMRQSEFAALLCR